MVYKIDYTLHAQHNQYLSIFDLEKLDDWNKAWKGQDKELFEKILYENGADLNYDYEIRQCFHVSRTKPFKRGLDIAIFFKERSDKEFEPYKAVEDIARDHESSFVRAGMTESLNSGLHLADFIEDELSKHVRYLEMKSEEKKGK